MTDVTITAKNVSVEYSGSLQKVEVTIEGFGLSEVINNIGLDEIISSCSKDDVLSCITFSDIEQYIKDQGYLVIEDIG